MPVTVRNTDVHRRTFISLTGPTGSTLVLEPGEEVVLAEDPRQRLVKRGKQGHAVGEDGHILEDHEDLVYTDERAEIYHLEVSERKTAPKSKSDKAGDVGDTAGG